MPDPSATSRGAPASPPATPRGIIARLLVGDVFERMAQLPDHSIDLVLTSPPFLSQRSYLPDDHPRKADEIGQEEDASAFVDVLLRLAAEWRRLLKPTGSLCVELGDTYHRKSLALVPEAFRFGLAYGRSPFTGSDSPAGRWIVRNVVRWMRPDPPIGALGDKFRPATSEMVIACTNAARYFDLDAVRTPANQAHAQKRFSDGWGNRSDGRQYGGGNFLSDTKTTFGNANGVPPMDWWSVPWSPDPPGDPDLAIEYLLDVVGELTDGGDPLDRDSWVVPTQPYRGAHTATWPADFCVRPIKAMCPPGGTVLDPFAGSGTTLAVATGLGRQAIGIDIDERNADLCRERVGMFLEIDEPEAAA